MYPFINIGTFHLGTFGLCLWLAAVLAAITLHRTFVRDGVDADALNVVAVVVIGGIVGAKLWHELQNPHELALAMTAIGRPGFSHPWQVVVLFFRWFQAGFAWFGGLLFGILCLFWQGVGSRPNGLSGSRAGLRMMDLAAPAAAVGYGVGRIGCMTSGDGDYGRETTSWVGVHLSPQALVPTEHFGAKVLPTPFFEFFIALALAAILWQLGRRARPLAWLTGVYLMLTGCERFIIEFWRINPRLYFNHHSSNAQVAALGSVVAGAVLTLVVSRNAAVGGEVPRAARVVAEPAVQT